MVAEVLTVNTRILAIEQEINVARIHLKKQDVIFLRIPKQRLQRSM